MRSTPASAGAQRRNSRGTVVLAAATVAAVDLAAKAVSEVRLVDSTVDLGLIQLRLAFNPGVAFSLGDTLPFGVIVAATAALTVACAVYAWHRAPHAGWIERIAGGAVIGGAMANVVDRARDGLVTDYLHTGWWPTFNLADAFLVIGCTTLALIHARSDHDVTTGKPPTVDARRIRHQQAEPASTDTDVLKRSGPVLSDVDHRRT